MIDIMEQANWIQAERILEGEGVYTRSQRDEAMDRRTMAALQAQMLALKIDDTDRQAEPSDEGWEVRETKRFLYSLHKDCTFDQYITIA